MNPANGRFQNMDSFEGDRYAPASLHKYLYTAGNPVNKVDPSGLFFIDVAIGNLVRATLATLSVVGPIAAAIAITCGLDFAATGGINEAGGNLAPVTPCDARNKENRVYRGTDRYAEILTFQDTGHILSDEAQRVFQETGSLITAYSTALKVRWWLLVPRCHRPPRRFSAPVTRCSWRPQTRPRVAC